MDQNETDKNKPYYRIGSLEKGLMALELLALQGPLTVSQLAKLLGFNRSAVYRFVATLRDIGYVAQEGDGKFRTTLRMFSFGRLVVDRLEIRDLAKHVMLELSAEFGETVNLGCIENNELVVVDLVKSQKPLKSELPPGSRGAAHATALGKAILSFSDEETVSSYIKGYGTLTQRTPNTISSIKVFRAELKNIKTQGFAVDDEEWAEGIRCIAVPIFDYTQKPVYSLSISGPTQRMTKTAIYQMRYRLNESSMQVSKLLGYDVTID
ncbi:MAG: IclR family transcriptional regulator [Desulfarculaceae bacterium]|nr:IclR family transcriptional regulator [Desulfarculaceae bacterium]